MSISLTIYDIFSNLIPGVLVLYVINELLIILKLRAIDLSQLDQAPNLILVAILAYITGHLINAISYQWWYVHFSPKALDEIALEKIKRQNPNLAVEFDPVDHKMLLSVIRHHSSELSNILERARAMYMMLRNVSLGAALFAMLQVVQAFITGQYLTYLPIAAVGMIGSALALHQGKKNERWFYRDIFREGLNYGTNIEEVMNVSRGITRQKSGAVEREVDFE